MEEMRPEYDAAEPMPTEALEGQVVPSLDDDEDLQKEVLAKIRTHGQKGKTNRMAEVQNARDQRLYFRSIQQFYWSEDKEDVIFETEDDSPYDRTFNIYQAYAKIFIATFMGAKPKVRAEADDPFDGGSIRAAAQANVFERVYRKWNDTSDQQLEVSRLMFTDGRVVSRTTNKQGKQITEFYGVLESRLPIAAKVDKEIPLKNCPMMEIEDEFPQSQMKRDYPDARKKINSGNGDSYERNARMAVKRQSGTDTSMDTLTGDDSYGMATKTWTYLRPEFFEDFQDGSRETLLEMFPDGCCIVRNGDVYLESYPCNPDAELDVIHALPGDGMSRPSIGAPLMPLQDSTNTSQNLIEETLDHGIPTTYYNQETQIDTLNEQRNMPGVSRKMVLPKGSAAKDQFFESQALNPSAQLMNYAQDIRGPQAQFVVGTPPALFGADMQDQKTASGYAQARSMALGQMAIVWKPYTSWYARETTRAVRMASQGQDEITATLPSQRPGASPDMVRMQPGELQGASFTNESDENFPETWTEKSNKFMNVLQMAASNPDFADKINAPDNLYLMKDFLGLQDLVIVGEDIRNNVIDDIAAMEHVPPVPDTETGQPMSSVDPDMDFMEPEDVIVAFKKTKDWINSTKGREAKINNPDWYMNVRLYGLKFKQAMQANEDATKPQPPSPPPPGLTLNQDVLTPGEIDQALAQRGIKPDPPVTAPINPEMQPQGGVQ